MRTFIWFVALALSVVAATKGDEGILPPGDTQPILRLEAGGPLSYLSDVAFSPQGDRLYATGWDKVVHVWSREADGTFVYRPGLAFRVPVGAGPYGGLNALALSDDDQYLAVGGQGYARGIGGLKAGHWIQPRAFMTPDALLDNGLIYVFHTTTRKVTLLRGHTGPVLSLTFVRGRPENSSPMLVSAAHEDDDKTSKLRVWEIATAAEVAQFTIPRPLNIQPGDLRDLLQSPLGVQAWATGKDPKQMHVALAWRDQPFRVWDVASNNAEKTGIMRMGTSLLLPGAQQRRLLIGGQGKIGEYTVPADLNGTSSLRSFSIPSLGEFDLVSASTLIPANQQQNQGPYALFVVTKYLNRSGTDARYRLLVTTTTADVRVEREIPLAWQGGVRKPALSCSPDGQTVAVVGNERNEVELYSVADLLAGRNTPPKVLQGDGLLFREAAFVRKDDKMGLVFSNNSLLVANLPPDALVFDIPGRKVERDTANWKLATERGTDWRVAVGQDGQVSVDGPGQPVIKIPLMPSQSVICTAICPPSNQCNVALVAIASHEFGQPKLQLFRADSGEEIRRCTAHTDRIRSVAFSDDGRLLVSTANDRVTAVWSLVDIAERLLNKRGRLPGVAVRLGNSGQSVVVVQAPEGSNLMKDDVVISAQRGNEEVPLPSTTDFYRYVLDRLPGDQVNFTVRRNGQVQRVTTRVRQAIEDVKPLFSVFLANRTGEPGWSWIGWHPLGKFDASDEQAEQRLAWHFNTGEADAPAKFAVIGEYRDDFYQHNLLAQLIADGGIRKPVPAVEEPEMSLKIERSDGESWGENDVGELLIRRPDAHVAVLVEGLPESRIHSVNVRIADAGWQPLAMRRDGKWSANLSNQAWTRGKHRVEMRLRTAETEPQELTQIQRFEYQPEPPRMEWSPEPPLAEVTQADLRVAASVKTFGEAAQVELSIERPGQPAKVIKQWQDQRELAVAEVVMLAPGQNRLTLRAWNASAPAGANQREAETAKLVADVQFKNLPDAPQIKITMVESLLKDGATTPVTIEAGLYRTIEPRLRIEGLVVAKQPLSKFSLKIGKKDEHVPETFRENQAAKFEFDETLTLFPGQQTILLKATANDAVVEQRIDVFFAPRLPRIESVTLKEPRLLQPLPKLPPREPNQFFAGFHSAETTLQITLKGNLREEYPYKARVFVGDDEVPEEKIKITRVNDLQADVTLPFGKAQRIQVRLSNEWKSESTPETILFEFERRPKITTVNWEKALQDGLLSLECEVESTLPPLRVRVRIDDQEDPQHFALSKIAAEQWRLNIDKAGLPEGTHKVRVQVENADGEALVAATRDVNVSVAKAPPPKLSIESSSSSTTNSVFELLFKLESQVPSVVTARVFNKDNQDTWSDKRQVQPPDTRALLSWKIPIGLGPNTIELVAVNDGGQAKQMIGVTRNAPPLLVEIEGIEIKGIDNFTPRTLRSGELVFDRPVPNSRGLMLGRVEFADQKQLLSGELSARVWVNSFKLPTVPVTVNPAKPKLGRFQADVVFNLKKGNRVRVEVFRTEKQLASELGSMNEVMIDCLKPEREQELHLLLIGVSEGEGERLKEGAREFLQAEMLKSDASLETWKSGAFSKIHVVEIFDKRMPQVKERLRRLVDDVNQHQRRQTQPIVMIYYRGQVVISEDNFALKTIENWDFPTITTFSQALNGRIMERSLRETNGAHLICLDLKQPTNAVESSSVWPKVPNLGVMVGNWKGPGAAPEDARLISVLKKAMPQARQLRQLDDHLREQYVAAQKRFPDKVESVQSLKNLYDLQLID